MKNKLKIFILRIFFRCEITESNYSSLRQESRWTFKFHPRKAPITILGLIYTILVFIKTGYEGVIDFWRLIYTVESWSSYSIWSENKPSESECYEKF